MSPIILVTVFALVVLVWQIIEMWQSRKPLHKPKSVRF
jgi:hypothetical protein